MQYRTRTSITRDFLDMYLDFFIEEYPDGTKPRLPMMVKKEVHESDYKPFMESQGFQPVCYRWFCGLWQQLYGHAIMTDKRRFGQCNTCSSQVRAYFLADTRQEKLELLLNKSGHIEFVRNCRRHVTLWHSFCKHFPREGLFMMMDGMDQNKTSIPRDGRFASTESVYVLRRALVEIVKG